MLIVAGVIGATILLLVFSKKNPGIFSTAATSYAGGGDGMDAYSENGYEEEEGDCTGPCDAAQNEMACVSCLLGPEESACYAECNIAKNDVACDGCLGALDYEPEWLSSDVWGEYQQQQQGYGQEEMMY